MSFEPFQQFMDCIKYFLTLQKSSLVCHKDPLFIHTTQSPQPSKKNTNQGVKISLKHKNIAHLDALIAATQETSTHDSAEDFL
jgi:hypothetical protein